MGGEDTTRTAERPAPPAGLGARPSGFGITNLPRIARGRGTYLYDVNGKRYQDGNTQTMVFGVAKLVSYISRFMTLYPGDLISTGTPPGVGMGQKPPRFLKPGDQIALGIAGLGEQRQKVYAWDPALIDG